MHAIIIELTVITSASFLFIVIIQNLKMLVILNFVSRWVFEGLTMVTGKAEVVLCMPLGHRVGEDICLLIFSVCARW
jgi:hypothetical protein